jgi:SagB-type dehydrogenase family enzyme
MSKLYKQTVLTPRSVAGSVGYLDWGSQPAQFKQYPDFLYRFPHAINDALKVIDLSRKVTLQTEIADRPYYQLNVPSAGNLHPVELYVQIRGIKGVISGIYHVDSINDSLVLIKEVDEDGIESSVGLDEKLYGVIFIVSATPYRSEWKYGDRALRYCYLDVGHQIGAIKAASYICGYQHTILSDFDLNALNTQMGFNDQEFACAALAVGISTNKKVQNIEMPLMQVSPTDYCDTNGFIAKEMLKHKIYEVFNDKEPLSVNEEAVLYRRSARRFFKNSLPKEKFEHFMNLLSRMNKPQSWHTVVLQGSYTPTGIYKNKALKKDGDYTREITELLVGQKFLANASMIVIITSKRFNSNELMNASADAHKVHLEAQMKGVGFSGIGAFYDEKIQNFLGTKEHVLYVFAIGAI